MTALKQPHVDLRIAVGERLRKLRGRRGLTQQEVATRVGVNPASLSNYENGKRDPPIQVLLDLAAVLETPAAALFDVPHLIIVEEPGLAGSIRELQRKMGDVMNS